MKSTSALRRMSVFLSNHQPFERLMEIMMDGYNVTPHLRVAAADALYYQLHEAESFDLWVLLGANLEPELKGEYGWVEKPIRFTIDCAYDELVNRREIVAPAGWARDGESW